MLGNADEKLSLECGLHIPLPSWEKLKEYKRQNHLSSIEGLLDLILPLKNVLATHEVFRVVKMIG